MLHKLFLFFFLFVCSFGQTIFAQDDGDAKKAYTLEEAQNYALQHNINLLTQKINSEIANEQTREIRAMGLPQVNANVNWNHFVQLPVSLVPAQIFDPTAPEGSFQELVFGTKNNITASLEASQLIFSGSYLVALEAAKEFVNLKEEELIQVEQDVKLAVTQTYYTALIAAEQITLLEKNKGNLEKILFETEAYYENGFVEAIDVDRLKLSLANLTTQIITSKRNAEVAIQVLQFQMGTTESIELADDLKSVVAEMEAVALETGFKPQQRVEYRVLEQQEKLNELDLKRYSWERLPSLAAFGSYQQAFQSDKLNVFAKDEFTNTDFWFPTFVVGLQLQVPIFQGLRLDAQMKQRKLSALQIRDAKELLKQSFALEISQSKTEYLNALEQMRSQKANLELAQKIYDVALIKYNEGLGSSLEVNSAESELFQTQGLYVQALFSLVNAKMNFEKASGTL